MSPRLRAVLVCAALLALTPASASAARTLVVDPSGANGAHRTIGAAVADAGPGDTISVLKADYPESVTIPERLTDLTVTGVDGPRLLGGSSADDVLRVQATGVRVNTIAVEVPAGARTGVRVDATGTATLTGVAVDRAAAPSGSDVALVDVAGGATIAKGFVGQRGGGTGAPAIGARGPGGVTVLDTTAFSTSGPALLVSASDRNLVARSTLASTDADSDAVRVVAATAGSRRLGVDSSELVGGSGGAGVRVLTQGAPAADETTLALRHVTVFGAERGLVLDATPPRIQFIQTGTAGSIGATVDASIVHEPSFAKGAPANGPFAPNRVRLALTDVHSPPIADADRNEQAEISLTRVSVFAGDPRALFGRGLHLRAGSPVIDKGPEAPAGGESATDIDGQPRRIGGATDLGADEFLNVGPRVTLSASNARPAQREPVTFTATFTDDNVGDEATMYFWDFGDGTRTSTTVPTVSHAFEQPGEQTVKVAAVDRGGMPSDVASTTLTVRDVEPPSVRITWPRAGSVLDLDHRGRRPRRLAARGTDSDASGVSRVEVALRRSVSRRSCRHYTGRRFAKGSCSALRWVPARLVGDSWRMKTRRGVRVRRGRYVLLARATDVNGSVSTPAAPGSLVRFSVE